MRLSSISRLTGLSLAPQMTMASSSAALSAPAKGPLGPRLAETAGQRTFRSGCETGKTRNGPPRDDDCRQDQRIGLVEGIGSL